MVWEMLVAGGLINAIFNGIGSYYEQSQRNKELDAQARALEQSAKEIQKAIDEGKIDIQEAIKRIDTLVSNTKGKLKQILERQINRAAIDLNKQFETYMENLRTTYIQRGLPHLVRIGGQKGLEKQAEELRKLRERGADIMAEKMIGMEWRAEGMRQNLLREMRNLNLWGTQQMAQLNARIEGLKASQANPWTAGLIGATKGGLGSLTSALYYGGLFGGTKSEKGK